MPDLGALIAPGVADAAFSSLAGFTAAVYAARTLDVDELGLFGVVFAATIFSRLGATQLLLVPYAQQLLGLRREDRAIGLRYIVLPALTVTLPAAAVSGLAGLPLHNQVSGNAFLAISITGALSVIIAPLFDFARRILHLSGYSWDAALVSASQLVAIVTVIGVLMLLGVSGPFVPFSALALSTSAAVMVGLILSTRRTAHVTNVARPHLRALLRAGRPLMAGSALGGIASVLAPILVGTLASAEEAGRAEAARIAAQPIFVLAIGLSLTLGPRLMEAGHDRARAIGIPFMRTYAVVIATFGLSYCLFVGFDHPLNPMSAIVPAAYAVGGLAAARILTNTFSGVESAPVQVLLGASKNSLLFRFSVLHAVALTATTALLASRIGAFALPIGEAVSTGTRAFVAFPAANATLREPPPAADTPPTSPGRVASGQVPVSGPQLP